MTALTVDDLVASVALGPDGRLYVSDYGNDQILVFDAADLAADGALTPAAVITNAGLIGPMGGGFDRDGRLWVGHYTDDVLLRFDGVLGITGDVDLVRLPDPASYTGHADVSGDLDLELTWYSATGTGYPDGGTMTFIPTQGPHAGY